tara:strand:+ start:1112 stop:1675 length:564 start_codon:yes stop_codon:yes gene_type:complete
MRIVGGSLKGKKILNPFDKSTRPLKDIVRESIFNILKHSKNESIDLNKSKILDLFSGTGSFGIECLSRGADKVVFFENYQKSIEILKKNIKNLNLISRSEIFIENAYNLKKLKVKHQDFDLIFIDPPFKDIKINLILTEIKKFNFYNNKTLVVIHRHKKIKEILSKDFIILKEKIYGLSKIIFGKIT